MKAFLAMAALGLGLAASIGGTSAQPYGGPGYRDRGPDYDYRDRGPRYDDRRGPDHDYRDQRRGGGYGGGGGYAFDEREYLRCHPDVRRAVMNGQIESGEVHYRRHGRGEGRRLSC